MGNKVTVNIIHNE